MKDYTKFITASYVILLRGDEVLLSRRYKTGYQDGNYSLPAGHIELHETAQHCALREAMEEIGVELQAKDCALAHTMCRLFPRDSVDRFDFFFCATQWSGQPVNKEPEKCDDLSWFKLDALPDNTIPYIRSVLELVHRGVRYSETVEHSAATSYT